MIKVVVALLFCSIMIGTTFSMEEKDDGKDNPYTFLHNSRIVANHIINSLSYAQKISVKGDTVLIYLYKNNYKQIEEFLCEKLNPQDSTLGLEYNIKVKSIRIRPDSVLSQMKPDSGKTREPESAYSLIIHFTNKYMDELPVMSIAMIPSSLLSINSIKNIAIIEGDSISVNRLAVKGAVNHTFIKSISSAAAIEFSQPQPDTVSKPIIQSLGQMQPANTLPKKKDMLTSAAPVAIKNIFNSETTGPANVNSINSDQNTQNSQIGRNTINPFDDNPKNRSSTTKSDSLTNNKQFMAENERIHQLLQNLKPLDRKAPDSENEDSNQNQINTGE